MTIDRHSPEYNDERAQGAQGAPEETGGRAVAGGAGRIRQLVYDAQSVDLIAETLAVEVRLAEFQLPGASVWQLLVPGVDGRPATMLTLWPSIHRVDAIGPGATVVFTEVTTVDLVAEVEVQFRRASREYLIAARGGKIIVRS
jgi:hypothetical protein